MDQMARKGRGGIKALYPLAEITSNVTATAMVATVVLLVTLVVPMGYGSVAQTNGSNNHSHTNGNSNSSGSKSSSSHQIVVPHDVMVKAQAEMRKAGYELLDHLDTVALVWSTEEDH
ncbi:uncharacterized protein [Apostichopus japonicus]|uniref:uncharacterized protein n=1 Tax=Stichopus japonicus TaxID=307972 RepID=UPI003AB6455C